MTILAKICTLPFEDYAHMPRNILPMHEGSDFTVVIDEKSERKYRYYKLKQEINMSSEFMYNNPEDKVFYEKPVTINWEFFGLKRHIKSAKTHTEVARGIYDMCQPHLERLTGYFCGDLWLDGFHLNRDTGNVYPHWVIKSRV